MSDAEMPWLDGAPPHEGTYHFGDEPQTERRADGKKSKGNASEEREQPASEWAEPIDILADPKLTGVATVDADCLPESILALATAQAARLQVDPSHIAALAIGTISAVISDDWRVRLKVHDQGWVEHPCIWTAVVAESGQKKTDCLRSVMRGINKQEAKLRDQYQKEKTQYDKEKEAWNILSKAERGPQPKPPSERRIVTDDFTPEALSDRLQSSDKILIRADELATFLGASERYSKGGGVNASRALMLQLYDGGPRSIDRVTRGSMFVENWSAVPVGHIQPAKVRPLVSGLSADGMMQRFMICMPPAVVLVDPDNDDVRTDWHAVDRYEQVVEILFALQRAGCSPECPWYFMSSSSPRPRPPAIAPTPSPCAR